jgi:hypothetical protein
MRERPFESKKRVAAQADVFSDAANRSAVGDLIAEAQMAEVRLNAQAALNSA